MTIYNNMHLSAPTQDLHGGFWRSHSNYDQGVPAGTHREWTVEGDDVATHTFENGRLRDVASHHWPNGQLKAQGAVLQPRYRLQVEPDWWNGTIHIQSSQPIGEPHKVGDWSYFSEDGRTTQTAAYVRGEREGLFTWWYPNGQLLSLIHI